MTKHTPGPWLCTVDTGACFHRGNRVSIYASGDRDVTIAEVWPTPGEDGDVADGRLIAAAPDMLATLKAVLKGIPEDYDDAHTLSLLARVQWAIDRAHGIDSECGCCGGGH